MDEAAETYPISSMEADARDAMSRECKRRRGLGPRDNDVAGVDVAHGGSRVSGRPGGHGTERLNSEKGKRRRRKRNSSQPDTPAATPAKLSAALTSGGSESGG